MDSRAVERFCVRPLLRPSPISKSLGVVGLLSLALSVSSCVRELPGESVPASAKLYFPNRVAVGPDGRTAVVVSSNFDQRFRSGWLTTVDVPLAMELAAKQQDVGEAMQLALRVPSLGGEILLSEADKRGYLAHRGQGLVTALDLGSDANAKLTLGCGVDAQLEHGPTAYTSCDSQHVYNLQHAIGEAFDLSDDPRLDQFTDPYALALVQSPNETPKRRLVVGMLNGRKLAVLTDQGPTGLVLDGLLSTQSAGIYAIAASNQGPWVAASRAPVFGSMFSSSTRGAFLMGLPTLLSTMWQQPHAAPQTVLPPYSLTDDLGATNDEQDTPQTAALTFSPADPTRLFALTHSPDGLVMLSLTSPPKTNVPGEGLAPVESGPLTFTPLAARVLSNSTPSSLAYLSRPYGDLLVVASLAQDMLYFFDPTSDQLQLVHRMALPRGSGPADVAIQNQGDTSVVVVSTFFNHGLILVDASSPSFADFHVITSFTDAHFAPAPRHR